LAVTQRRYFLPVAAHRTHPERLLLLDEDEQWFLWDGGASAAETPLAIEPALGHWMAHRPELFPLPQPLMWIAADDLPLGSRESGVGSRE
jgi:hypothetical protein